MAVYTEVRDTNDEPEPELERLRRLAGLQPEPPRIPYGSPERVQLVLDAVMRAAKCSGVVHDRVMGHYVYWHQGRVIGDADSAELAAHRLTVYRLQHEDDE